MTRHVLKTWPEYFGPVWDGKKTFEVRSNDRNYQVGDELLLREYDLLSDEYSGRHIACEVTYMLDGTYPSELVLNGCVILAVRVKFCATTSPDTNPADLYREKTDKDD